MAKRSKKSGTCIAVMYRDRLVELSRSEIDATEPTKWYNKYVGRGHFAATVHWSIVTPAKKARKK